MRRVALSTLVVQLVEDPTLYFSDRVCEVNVACRMDGDQIRDHVSITDGGQRFAVFVHNLQAGCGKNNSYLVRTKCSFPGIKTAGDQSSPLASSSTVGNEVRCNPTSTGDFMDTHRQTDWR